MLARRLILTNLYFKLEAPGEARQAAERALALGAPRGKALHGLALAMAARRSYGAAAERALEASRAFREEENAKMEAGRWPLGGELVENPLKIIEKR